MCKLPTRECLANPIIAAKILELENKNKTAAREQLLRIQLILAKRVSGGNR